MVVLVVLVVQQRSNKPNNFSLTRRDAGWLLLLLLLPKVHLIERAKLAKETRENNQKSPFCNCSTSKKDATE
jgi:hypothetical protein